MREMKDSGMEWLGEVPACWNNDSIRHLLIARDGGAWGEEVTNDGEGTVCLRVADFDYAKGRFHHADVKDLTHRKYSEIQIRKLLLQPGDILFEKSGGGDKTPVGRAVLFDGEYDALFANFMERLRFDTSAVLPDFVEYWLRAWYACRCSPYYIKQTIGIQNIDLSMMLAKEKLFFPSLAEQHHIVSFLHTKCAETDGLIFEMQAQTDALEQYKCSVITEAVTKGLRPDAEIQDSGIGWIGGIPSHWTFSRIGSLYRLRVEKVSDNDFEPLSVTKYGIVPQLETAAKTNAHDDRKRVKKGDFVINSRSDRRGSCGISDYDGSVSLINTVLHPVTNMNPRYYNWLFHTTEFADEFYRWGHGIVDDLWTTRWQDMKNIVIMVPPLNEQAEIADFLDAKCAGIDEIIDQKREQLSVMEEYKNSLIFEYVTGKKQVEERI